jgi:hypothetical protein
MFYSIEFARVLSEWRLRWQRVKAILSPPQWDHEEWRQFSKALAVLVRRHGASWIIDPKIYWDMRWALQGGGDLICQIEHIPEQKTTLIVAQTGGFAKEMGSYTWLWAEFGMDGEFSRDLYWVDGTWREALMTLLAPFQYQAGYYLEGPRVTPNELLLQDGARPNPDRYLLVHDSEQEREHSTIPV